MVVIIVNLFEIKKKKKGRERKNNRLEDNRRPRKIVLPSSNS
jgi:hypothetical protein